MFDTNIFNRILAGYGETVSLKGDNKYYITHIQLDEINDTKDETRRNALLKVFHMVNNVRIPTESAVWGVSKWDEAKYSNEETILPTESFVLGHSRLGMAKLSDGNLYTSILNELQKIKPKQNDNNIKDALIAETSIKNGFDLITADIALYDTVKKLGGNVLNWDEFLTHGVLQ
jgi:hypothetical protein